MDSNKKHSIYDVIIATGFGSGYWPWGPGTAGAVLATVIWCCYAFPLRECNVLYGFSLSSYSVVEIITAILVIMFTIISIKPIDRIEKSWGEDPSKVVVDEMVGVWIALLAVPQSFEWIHCLLALLLFRVFDIAKPLGVRWIDNNVKGGWGVMLDDILAGAYSAITLFVISVFI